MAAKKVRMGGAVRAKVAKKCRHKPDMGSLPAGLLDMVADLRAEQREERAAVRGLLERIAVALEANMRKGP